MLKLKQITKTYGEGSNQVQALRGLDICFRANEFVAILGQSGCGKTTLLNLIGGLDQYTTGDLLIAGRSTRQFKDRDWDSYRNHSIGFVFQSYNLIPHQSVLANVELALTLSGVSKTERRRRAKAVLEQVGLGDQLHKRPNQMSGGQMQRVAIARALVNDPEILLADEPTGALDSETSVQVMEILKEVARDRLVIMVTHNPELADQYATRTVRLLDGRIIADSHPYPEEEEAAEHLEKVHTGKEKKPSMSMGTALGLSLNNLMTKKGRTVLTAFAGAIGIIGIALILSLSNGIQTYIDQVQEDTLSSYPIQIQAETLDMTAMMASMMGKTQEKMDARDLDGKVYANTVMYDMMNSVNNAQVQTNNLTDFKAWLQSEHSDMADCLSAVQYTYDLNMDIYTQDPDGVIIKSDVMELMSGSLSGIYGEGATSLTSAMSQSMSAFGTMRIWQEMLPGEDGQAVSPLLQEQYDLIHGSWPQAYDEVVLIVTENNELPDLMLFALGLKDQKTMQQVAEASLKQEEIDTGEDRFWTYEELCQKQFKILLPSACYEQNPDGTYRDLRETEAGLDYLYNSAETGIPLRVVGILRPDPDATSTMLSGTMGYTSLLTKHILDLLAEQPILAAQLADPATDVVTGLPFPTEEDTEPTAEEKRAAVLELIEEQDTATKASMYLDVASQPSEDFLDQTVNEQMEGLTRSDIEKQVMEQYAAEMGVDEETIRDYIAEMDDATLFGNVEEAIRQAVAQQYTEATREQLSAMTNEQLAANLDLGSISDEELESLLALSTLPVEQLAYMLQTGEITQEQFGLAQMPAEQLAMLQLSDSQYIYLYDHYMPPTVSDSTYEDNLELLGYVDKDSPASISLYAATFADKDTIAEQIQAYNDTVEEEDQISYTDYVAILMSSITTIINAISYVLIAFVAISLVVSSIMIAIITYISVLERTKEIGILRAVGASKSDISRVFNAETFIEGLVSGIMGIVVTLVLLVPINAIVQHLTGIESLQAILPWQAAGILIGISVLLTVLAGLVPAKMAARKDPVEALRSE